MAKQGILVEICCGSLEDALGAEQGGADRVELCSALFLGGLTPSFGTIVEAKARLKIPVVVMIRPRGGGFCYTQPEMAVMERDAALAADQGADGIVFGILNADGSITAFKTQVDSSVRGRPFVTFGGALYPPDDQYQVADRSLVERVVSTLR